MVIPFQLSENDEQCCTPDMSLTKELCQCNSLLALNVISSKWMIKIDMMKKQKNKTLVHSSKISLMQKHSDTSILSKTLYSKKVKIAPCSDNLRPVLLTCRRQLLQQSLLNQIFIKICNHQGMQIKYGSVFNKQNSSTQHNKNQVCRCPI